MPSILLVDFIDIVTAGGTPKASKIKRIKNRGAYSPASDFYKQIREKIINIHRNGNDKSELRNIVNTITDPKKNTAYPTIIKGYLSWWGRKQLSWFNPPSDIYTQFDVDVRVNPELGLVVNGTPHLIKLHFKAEKLSKYRVDVITHLMSVCLGSQCPSGTLMTVLDVRRSKPYCPTVPIPTLDTALSGELAYISTVWPKL